MPTEFTFTCPLAAGLHARPASMFSEAASAFSADCTLTNLRSGATANLKSTLAIIGADVRSGDLCRVQCSGTDESRAFAALRELAERKLPHADDTTTSAPQQQSVTLPRALRDAECKYLTGTAVSPGIAIGEVIQAASREWPALASTHVNADPALQRDRIDAALRAATDRIGALAARAKSKTESAVLNAHLSILNDVSFLERIHQHISNRETAESAVIQAAEHFRKMLRSSDSAYIRERAVDIQDVAHRVLEHLDPEVKREPRTLTRPSVVCAEILTPQELLAMKREFVAAIVMEYASATSHTVILARSLGIPTLAAVTGASSELRDGERVIVDADRGFLIHDDSPAVQRFYTRELETQRRRREHSAQSTKAVAKTVDGRQLEVGANISAAVEIEAAFQTGADGIGVFRTEMLFVDRNTAPTEQEQYEIYSECARAADGRPVIIRTLDIGGDKRVAHMNLPEEPNPFLGYRGARIYPEHLELFRSQVRAILRASAFGRVQIMLPMISNAAEVRWAREQVDGVRKELIADGEKIGDVPLGIMIEVPSTAYSIAELSEVADFFSVGTNDLSQYFFAADRGNVKVWPLADSTQPAFLRLLKHIIDEAHSNKKWIGICGEMGGDVRLLPLMLGLGFDEISASIPNVAPLKQRVAELRQEDCAKLVSKAIASRTAEDVSALIDSVQSTRPAQPLLAVDLVTIDSDSANKEEVIHELIGLVYAAGRTNDRDRLEEAVWKREEVYSTALGFGFAIPHCKNDVVISDSIAVAKLAKPIVWGEDSTVSFAILLAMRESAKDNTHMQVFSRLARKLMNEEFRARLSKAKTAEEVLTLLSAELAIAK